MSPTDLQRHPGGRCWPIFTRLSTRLAAAQVMRRTSMSLAKMAPNVVFAERPHLRPFGSRGAVDGSLGSGDAAAAIGGAARDRRSPPVHSPKHGSVSRKRAPCREQRMTRPLAEQDHPRGPRGHRLLRSQFKAIRLADRQPMPRAATKTRSSPRGMPVFPHSFSGDAAPAGAAATISETTSAKSAAVKKARTRSNVPAPERAGAVSVSAILSPPWPSTPARRRPSPRAP